MYPENLQVAHDNAMNTLNLLKSEIEEKQYQERKNQIKELEAEIDDLLFSHHIHYKKSFKKEVFYAIVWAVNIISNGIHKEKQRLFSSEEKKTRYALLHIRISKSTGYTNTRKM